MSNEVFKILNDQGTGMTVDGNGNLTVTGVITKTMEQQAAEAVKPVVVKRNKKDGVVKIFNYARTQMKFVEQDAQGKYVNSGSFSLPARTQRVIINGKAVVVILQDGSKGVALCNEASGDVFNETKGIQIAYTRAKIESLKKELKSLAYGKKIKK